MVVEGGARLRRVRVAIVEAQEAGAEHRRRELLEDRVRHHLAVHPRSAARNAQLQVAVAEDAAFLVLLLRGDLVRGVKVEAVGQVVEHPLRDGVLHHGLRGHGTLSAPA